MEPFTITPLNVGKLRFEFADIYGLSRGEPHFGHMAEIPIVSYCIALPSRSVLVDAVGYNVEEIPAHFLIPGYTPPAPLCEQLRSHGLNPEAVTDVIITHAHLDHYSALSERIDDYYRPTFPRARHYLNRADWDPESFKLSDERTLKLIYQHGLLNLVDGIVELGDGLTIFPLPGETPGHQILRLMHNDQHIYFAGDLFHHPIEFVDPSLNVRWAAMDEMQTSKEIFALRVANLNGLVYFSHMADTYRVEKRNGYFSWINAESRDKGQA